MIPVVGSFCLSVLLVVGLFAIYQWAFAIASILCWQSPKTFPRGKLAKFLILIPAHNEESGISHTFESLARLRYPKELVHTIVIADRCDDATAVISERHRIHCLEKFTGPAGKGAAIAWAIGRVQRSSTAFDAVVILDADTLAESRLLEAFNDGLLSGHEIQQGYNYLSNPWQTLFTRIIAVTSVLRNGLFYSGKSRIGLSAMLTGTGMCFSRQVVERHGWTAFSVGEDWEFSVSLLLSGEKIFFNPMARVFARESENFKQASTQRLRWASGRYAVATNGAKKLFIEGIRLRRLYLLDAAITLMAPNYSTQATMAIVALFGAWFLSADPVWHFLLACALVVTGTSVGYFLLGVWFTQAPLRTLTGIALIPLFLPWRMVIEALGLFGFGRKRWVRTSRGTVPRSNH